MYPGGMASQQRIRGWVKLEYKWSAKGNSRTVDVEAVTDGGATMAKRSSSNGAYVGAAAIESRCSVRGVLKPDDNLLF